MLQNRFFNALFLTLFSPLFALPFFFLSSLAIAFNHPPGIHDPLRIELGPFLYNLRWSVAAAVMTAALTLNSLLLKFYISLPVLLAGNYALTYTFPGMKLRLIRALVFLLGSGFLYFVVIYFGLWLGLWEETRWT
jgi:hypothetical protein